MDRLCCVPSLYYVCLQHIHCNEYEDIRTLGFIFYRSEYPAVVQHPRRHHLPSLGASPVDWKTSNFQREIWCHNISLDQEYTGNMKAIHLFLIIISIKDNSLWYFVCQFLKPYKISCKILVSIAANDFLFLLT